MLDDELEPLSAAREEIDARGLGTLVHAVLAEIRLGEPVDVPAWSAARRAARSAAGDEQKLAESLVSRFLASPRAKQLAAAKSDFAELEFLLAWPPGDATAERLQLTGFIDRLYEDRDGEWHILDFKTNRVDTATFLRWPRIMSSRCWCTRWPRNKCWAGRPKTLTLHMLRSGDEFAFAWNDAARARVRKMVDEAIARLRGPAA